MATLAARGGAAQAQKVMRGRSAPLICPLGVACPVRSLVSCGWPASPRSRCEGEPLSSAQGMFIIRAMFLFLGAKSPVTFLTSVVDDVVVVASASALLGDVAGVEGAGLASCRSSAGLEGPCPSG